MIMFLVFLVILVIALLVFRRQRKPVHVRYARSKFITGKNAGTTRHPAKRMLPAETCPDCGRPAIVCQRKKADAEHAEGMLGRRRQ